MNDATRERTGCWNINQLLQLLVELITSETAMQADTEEWDGTSWSQMGNLVVAVKAMSCMGHTATGCSSKWGNATISVRLITTTQII